MAIQYQRYLGGSFQEVDPLLATSTHGAWGGITGNLDEQSDLHAALEAKSAIGHNHDGSYLPIDGSLSAGQVGYGDGTVADALDSLLYTAPEILAFALSVSTAELGSTVTSVTATWAYSKTMTTATLTDATIIPTDLANTWSPIALTSTKTYTLTAGDGVGSDSASATVSFVNRVCYGVSSKASGYSSSDVMALATKTLSGSKSRTITVAPGASEYILYAYPSRLGTVTFTVGGFEGGFEAPETVSVTNASGYTENFYVYRSTNTNLGSTTVSIA